MMRKWVSRGFLIKTLFICPGTKGFCSHTPTEQHPPSFPFQMVSLGAKMSNERRLWNRHEVSFPYIVVCRSPSRILMLSWRACRTASRSRKHDLGPGEKAPECPLVVEAASASSRCREREMGSVLSSCLLTLHHSLISSVVLFPFHTNNPSLFYQPFDFTLIPHILP